MKDFFAEFSEALEALDWGLTARELGRACTLAGSIAGIAVLYTGLFVVQSERVAVLAIPAFILPGVITYFLVLYAFDERKRKIEDEVPDLLLLASSLPARTPTHKLVKFMAHNASGPIASEFSRAERELNAGTPIEECLERMKARNKSAPLSRALDMVLSSIRSGAKMNAVFRETAEDFMQTSAIMRERSAATAIEKYTILIAGGLVVPLILGLIASMVANLDFSTASGLGIGMRQEEKIGLVNAASLASTVYIVEYAVIASMFVAFQEGMQRKAVLYALFLVPLGLVVYFSALGL